MRPPHLLALLTLPVTLCMLTALGCTEGRREASPDAGIAPGDASDDAPSSTTDDDAGTCDPLDPACALDGGVVGMDSGPPPRDAGPPPPPPRDAGPPPDAGSCSSLALSPSFALEPRGVERPSPVGGDAPWGEYELFSARSYTTGGSSGLGRNVQGVVRFDDTTYELRIVSETGSTESTGTFTTSGTDLALSPTCQRGAFAAHYPYDRGLNYVRLYLGNVILAFSLRP